MKTEWGEHRPGRPFFPQFFDLWLSRVCLFTFLSGHGSHVFGFKRVDARVVCSLFALSRSAAVLMLHYKQSEESARSCDQHIDQIIFHQLANPFVVSFDDEKMLAIATSKPRIINKCQLTILWWLCFVSLERPDRSQPVSLNVPEYKKIKW